MFRARLLVAAIVLFSTVGATPAPSITADLEGAPLAASAVGEHFCHDFDWPRVHCYRSAHALEAALRRFLPREASSSLLETYALEPSAMSVTATAYVKVYQYASYTGSLAFLSRDYPNLHDIGWGDRISSYIVSGAAGEFYTNPGYGGAIDYFCCNQSVPGLSSTFENLISSLDL